MKRLLNTTTALSLALFNVQPWPLMAQTLTEDGSVIAADGTVLCAAVDGVVCVPEEFVEQAAAIDAAMAEAAAIAAAEADAAAAAQVQADADAAAAAQAQAQAEADAAAAADAQAAADADAAAAADAQAQAEADSAAKAAADADAAAAAQAQAAAEADAAAAVEAQAVADAAAAAAAQAQAQADADAAAAAEAQAAADADAAAAADTQAQADAAAAAQAEADAKAAADAAIAAQTDADAAAAAQADADAKAAADAAIAAQTDADAAAAAQADADAKAAADAAAVAEADAALKAQLEADAAAQALVDAQAAADAAAAAGADAAAIEAANAAAIAAADAAALAETEAAAAAKAAQDAADAAAATALPVAPAVVIDPAVADPALVDENGVAILPDAAELPPEQIIDAPVLTAEEQAAADAAAALQAEADAAALAAAEAELKVQDDGTLADPTAGLKTADVVVDETVEPVDVLVPTQTEVETLSTLLSEPEAGVDPAILGAAAALATTAAVVAGADPVPLADQPISEDAVTSVTELLTEQSARASTQEFAAAPVAVAAGKKNRLSDLEKVGLVVLGALVVGAIINEGNKQEERRVVSNSGDRIVVLKPDGTYQVYKDDDTIIRRPGSNVRTETYRDGSTRTIVERQDGSQIVTIRDATGRVLRRAHYDDLGRELVLIDDLEPEEVVYVRDLPKPKTKRVVISTQDEDADLKAALAARDIAKLGRTFSLRQIREITEVRALAATIDVDTITFDSGSSAIKATEAQDLADLGRLMQDMIDNNPAEMFLIEGHTDATGKAALNLALSDRRAESVALALTEYFDIPPENMVIQGYGETELRIDTLQNEARNRRVAVRIITPLMRVQVAKN